MFRSKLLVGTVVAAATLGLSGVALANGGSYNPGYTPAPMSADSGAGFFVGLQGGYGLTHWDNIENHNTFNANVNVSRESGFVGRVFGGYMFNKYLGAEAGWAYLPSRIKVRAASNTSSETTVHNWAADISGVFVVPIQDQFGVFTKVGLNYFNSNSAPDMENSTSTNLQEDDLGSWNVVYGAGVFYDVMPQIRVTAAWKRYTGHGDVNDKYQPNPDVFLLGLQYRFASNFFSGDF